MRNFFQRLKAGWIFSQTHPHIDIAPDWTDDDAKILSKFLHSDPTGAKYRRTLQYHVQAGMLKAILSRDHATFENGYACGMRGLAAISDTLLLVRDSENGAEFVQPDNVMDLDSLRP